MKLKNKIFKFIFFDSILMFCIAGLWYTVEVLSRVLYYAETDLGILIGITVLGPGIGVYIAGIIISSIQIGMVSRHESNKTNN